MRIAATSIMSAPRRPMGPGSFFVPALLAVGVVVPALLVALQFWEKHRIQRRVEEVRAASSALCELATAQAEFRRLDLDGNGVADFWTGDVAGFYRTGQIPFEVAAADLRPLHPVVKTPVPYRGYYFMALERDDSDGEDYRQDTDGRSGAVHHRSRFGFIVFPAGPGPIPYAYILNENNSMFRKRLEPGRKLPTAWPSDPELKNFWSRAG